MSKDNMIPKPILIFTGIIFPAKRGIPKKNAPVLKKTKTHTTISPTAIVTEPLLGSY